MCAILQHFFRQRHSLEIKKLFFSFALDPYKNHIGIGMLRHINIKLEKYVLLNINIIISLIHEYLIDNALT